MKKILFILFLVFYGKNLVSQCDNGWTADIQLDRIIAPVTFENKKIILNPGFRHFSEVHFINCDIKVTEAFSFAEGSKIYMSEGTKVNACNEDDNALGFRGLNNGFTNPILAEFYIDDTYFDNLDELLHINFKPGSVFQFTNSTINYDSDYTHVFHFIDHGSLTDLKFYGNTINCDGTCITVENIGVKWIVGDNTKSRNIIRAGLSSMSPLAKAIHSSNETLLDLINTTFSSSKIALDISSEKVSIDNCIIENSIIGLDCKNSELKINNSTFKDCDKAIYFPSPNANLKFAQIVDNTFINNEIDLMTQGGSIDGYNIANNNFSGRDYGVLIDGDNIVNLSKNTFTDSYAGSIMNSTGSNTNLNRDNDFNSLLV